jgi:hypothetical protein
MRRLCELSGIRRLAVGGRDFYRTYYKNNMGASGITKLLLVVVDESRKLVVQYEDFFEELEKIFGQLVEILKLTGFNYKGMKRFKPIRNSKQPNTPEIEKALAGFEEQ